MTPSVRGLVDSDFDQPFKQFDGVFSKLEDEPARGYEGTRNILNFADVENVICGPGQAYHMPTIALNIGDSTKHKSRWGYFGDSLAALLADNEDIEDAIGKTFSMVFCDGADGRPEPKTIWQREPSPELLEKYPDKMIPTAVWIVVALDGASAGATAVADDGLDTAEYATKLLIGRNRGDFNKAAFADPRIRKDPALQRSITDKSFIASLVELGVVEEDSDGVFQAVA